MGYALSKHYYSLSKIDIADLKRETGFSNRVIMRLFNRFQDLDEDGNGFVTRERLAKIKEIQMNPIGDRLVNLFFDSADQERVGPKRFIKTFAVFKPVNYKTPTYAVNSKNSKMRLLFELIDTDKDGSVNAEEIYKILEAMMGAKVESSQLKMIAERIIYEANQDYEASDNRDRTRMTLSQYKHTVEKLEIEKRLAFASFGSS